MIAQSIIAQLELDQPENSDASLNSNELGNRYVLVLSCDDAM